MEHDHVLLYVYRLDIELAAKEICHYYPSYKC